MQERQHSLVDGRFTVPGKPLLTARGQPDRLVPAQYRREQPAVAARFPHERPATTPEMQLAGHGRLGADTNSDAVSGLRSSLTTLPRLPRLVTTCPEM
jgi:hypothetical protein